ncbi:hypothetical protein, partial [Leuconostoc mesenteroides]|uniref:hypothetical protein n=1 Tax=Leuconostoc mesenteroides TaxID=1245 RepID=UPI001C692F0C
LAITTKGFSAVCSVRLILAIYPNKKSTSEITKRFPEFYQLIKHLVNDLHGVCRIISIRFDIGVEILL